MFAFALWDARDERLLLARDRAGIKPLYYVARDGRIACASEIRPLLRLPWVSRELDPEALDLYLERGYVPAPRTLLRDVRKLPAAHRLVADRSGVHVERYWRPAPRDVGRAEPQALCDEVVRELDRSVREHLVSDVALGAFLSGGLDSSIVVSLMRRHCSGPLRTFSIGIEGVPDLDERAHARVVARHFGTEHHEAVLRGADMPALVQTTAGSLDEPVSDPAAVPTYVLAKLAREHVTVVLTGEGADETWAGYDVFRKGRMVAGYRRLPWWLRRVVTDPLLRRLPGGGAGARFVAASASPGYLARLSHVGAEMRRSLYTAAAARSMPAAISDEIGAPMLDPMDPFRSISEDLLDSHLAERLLFKVDRMTMAHGLEARVPFLDHHLVEFALAVPAAWKLRGRTTKYLLRRAFRSALPPSITGRPKHAFDLPCAAWLRSSLAPLLEDALALRHMGDLLDAGRARALWTAHRDRRADHAPQLWALLTLELWAQQVCHG
jgi:asparagine synthase (glutamine-hydrolysing)